MLITPLLHQLLPVSVADLLVPDQVFRSTDDNTLELREVRIIRTHLDRPKYARWQATPDACVEVARPHVSGLADPCGAHYGDLSQADRQSTGGE